MSEKKSAFYEYIDQRVKDETGKSLAEHEPDPAAHRARGLASKTGQLCAKLHEACLRTMTLRFLTARHSGALSVGDDKGVELCEMLFERYQTAPKESLIAYWVGCTDGAPTLKVKKEIYRVLDRQGKSCHLNTH
jgi:hypothetical protein